MDAIPFTRLRPIPRPCAGMLLVLALCSVLPIAATASSHGGLAPGFGFVDAQESNATAENADMAAESTTEPDELSDAERIASLQRTIEGEQQRLTELEGDLESPDSEYAQAERAFQEFDKELTDKQERLEELQQQGKSAEAAELDREIKAVEKQRELAKSRFELAIEERKTLREEVTTLRAKIQKDRDALNDLTGSEPPDDAAKPEAADGAATDAPQAGEDSGEKMSEEPADSDTEPEEPKDEELVEAEAEAKQKEDEADEAQQDAQAIAARIGDLQKIIGQEQRVLLLSRKKADLALETQQALEGEWHRRRAEGASDEELRELQTASLEAKQRFAEARIGVTESTDRLNDSRSELAALQSEQIVALQQARQKQLEAEAAQERVEDLRNPFAPRNVLQWLLDHGPRLLLIVLGMVVLGQMSKFFGQRTIRLVAGGTARGSPVERENRAKTLVGVFQNAASVAIVVGGTLMILEEVGANVRVLMGGVAVVGLAVAFGAQNLIKDYFSGFVMLLENQYMLNDMVKIGDLTGQVERITLRMTVLRDANGVVHFIPNGQINCVSNETHGWSRAVFEIGIAYRENVDRCMAVLAELAGQLRKDPVVGPAILDDPTPPGVDQLGESAVLIRFHIKTRPHQQGLVRRELLRRIKIRFDELGIELPFPQRTVHHRYESSTSETGLELKKCA